MDRINFLLTEVSLECLGNNFFDIYGEQSDTLLKLVSAESLQEKKVNADENTALWDVLGMEKHSVRLANHNTRVLQSPRRKRRASLSNQDDIDDVDPESLLVPMAKVPNAPAAKINRRRFTINVSQIQKQRKQAAPSNAIKSKSKGTSVAEIKEKLRNDIKSSM